MAGPEAGRGGGLDWLVGAWRGGPGAFMTALGKGEACRGSLPEPGCSRCTFLAIGPAPGNGTAGGGGGGVANQGSREAGNLRSFLLERREAGLDETAVMN